MPKRCRIRTFVALVVSLWLSAGGATAPRHAHAGHRAAAARHYRAGQRAYAAKRYAAAVKAFEAAGRAAPHPLNSYALARALHGLYRRDSNLAHLRRAVAAYQRFLSARGKSRWAPAARAALVEALGVLASRNALVSPTGGGASLPTSPFTRTQLLVTTSTPGARVSIDGRPRGGAPQRLLRTVKPGKHTVRVQAVGYAPRVLELVSVKYRLVSRHVELARLLPATLRVSTVQAGARVYLDGSYVGETPLERRGVPVGPHRLVLRDRGRRLWHGKLTLRRGAVSSKVVSLRWTTQRKVAMGVGIAGLGALASGLVVGLFALLEDSALDDLPRVSDDDRVAFADKLALRDRLAMAATVTLAGGAAALIAAALMYWFDMPALPSAGGRTRSAGGRNARRSAVRLVPRAGGLGVLF